MYYVVICAVGLFLRRPIVSMFVTGAGAEEVVRLGSEYLGVMAFFYLWPALTNAVQGFFRGMGKMFTTVIFTFVQASIRTVSTMIAPDGHCGYCLVLSDRLVGHVVL